MNRYSVKMKENFSAGRAFPEMLPDDDGDWMPVAEGVELEHRAEQLDDKLQDALALVERTRKERDDAEAARDQMCATVCVELAEGFEGMAQDAYRDSRYPAPENVEEGEAEGQGDAFMEAATACRRKAQKALVRVSKRQHDGDR